MNGTTTELHDQFLSVLPRIEGVAYYAFRTLPFDDREEAIAETVAHAWVAFARLIERGKDPLLFPTALAKFSVLAIKGGKLAGRRNNRCDLQSPFRKKRNASDVVSLEQASDYHEPPWKEVLTETWQSTPADTAAARIDISSWLCGLKRRVRRIAVALAEGNRPLDVARRFKLSPARISQLRAEFRRSWAELHGDAGERELAVA